MRFTSILPALLLAGCVNGTTTAITTATTNALATAQKDAATAVAFYQTAKGIAQVAELADPSLAGPINAGIAVLDPLMQTAQAALNAASTDAPALEALATQIQTQAVTLAQTAAPAIKVVAGN